MLQPVVHAVQLKVRGCSSSEFGWGENHDHFAKFSYASGLPGNLLSFSWEQHCSSWRRVWLPLNSTIVKWGTFQMASHWHATHLFIRATKTVFNAATTIAQIHHSGFMFIESSLFFFLNLSIQRSTEGDFFGQSHSRRWQKLRPSTKTKAKAEGGK